MIKGFKATRLTLCSLVASATLANAGESGVFLGIGGSFGLEAIAKTDIKTDDDASSVVKNTTKGLSGGGEFVLGYKYFFMEKLGIRGYASVDYAIVMLAKTPGTAQTIAHTYGQMISKPSGLLDMNINLDLILEAFSGDVFSLGFFAGVAGGFHLWHGGIVDVANGIKSLLDTKPDTIYNKKTQSIFGSVGVNVGMQMGFGERHTVEIIGKIPFLQDELISFKFSKNANQLDKEAQRFIRITRPYTVGLRYIFTF